MLVAGSGLLLHRLAAHHLRQAVVIYLLCLLIVISLVVAAYRNPGLLMLYLPVILIAAALTDQRGLWVTTGIVMLTAVFMSVYIDGPFGDLLLALFLLLVTALTAWLSTRRLFDPLLAEEDVLTNMHMNTTIPEVQGAARAWEVTGEPRWRQIVDAYWRSGVTEHGQTNGEVWSPPNALSSRLGFHTQEHCTVYNMMRLADTLLRWSDDPHYADYWERNLWNGILAQQHPETGMIAYFLPLYAGAEKVWGTPTEDFWCCHGSLGRRTPITPTTSGTSTQAA